MTDSQILTLAIAIVFPVCAVIYSNSRAGDINKRIDSLEKAMEAMEKRLSEKIDNAFEHMELLLKLHESEHHK